ncbi:SusC/RagA family TonB-linked outer membrane protein [Neotamlana laminarinivorans]|uniref:SusC/RagA family TonB-linked outer membrane protein n=1 Tax=Neotamlana laminarinivorans TaxID=2883124 RepID=A0A9X1L5C5_9FLAO|nr:SusC/RagA family TonB-linked outer membrane protein [Tamlana laminarinivorans]MCB4799241.1 SusC/RagA family TonB-linked outer membrane protein [Tamlana laminarinivorans]
MKKKFSRILTLLLAFIVHISYAQEKTISGTVIDSYGLPLPGATVLVKGTSTGTSTDFDGKYSLTANVGETIVFSFVGYTTKEVIIATSSTINVTLEEDAESLDEVVLTALGLEKKKDEDLSSTSIVKVNQLQKSGESGLLQGLSGKTSGLNITRNSGDPGSGAYIQIRGQNTILGSSSPLIVLDGAIISNNSVNLSTTSGVSEQSRLNDLNPEDIESISVLKGASAAAIYGTGAANGVLVIQTKRGKKGKMTVNYKSSVSIDVINREWDKQSTYGQGYPKIWDGIDNFEDGIWLGNYALSYGDKIANRSGGPDTVNTNSSEFFVADNGTTYYPILSKNDDTVYNQINRDAIFQNGLALENALSIGFSSEKSSTYVSISRWDQEGIYKGTSDYIRSTIKLNNDTQFSDKLKMRMSTQYSSIKSNRVQTGSNLNGLYLGYLRNPADFDFRDYKGTNFRDGITTPNSHRGYRQYLGSYRTFDAESGTFAYDSPTYNNPLWTTNQQLNLNTVDRFIISPEFNYKLSDNISLTGRYSIDYYQDVRTNYWPGGSASDGTNGLYSEDRITESNENYNFFINASHELSDAISMTWIAGYQVFDNKYSRLSVQETNFTNPDEVFLSVGNSTSENSTNAQSDTNTRTSGAYAVVNFTLWDELLLEATARGEYVSTLPNAGLIFYPSVSAGWDFSKRLEGSDILSFGKIRASYGEVGIEPTAYATSTTFSPATITSSWGDGLDGSLYGNPIGRSSLRGNPNLKEERIKEYEIGLDTRFFNNRVSLSGTYYSRTSEDVILALPTSAANGYSSEYRNAAEITNKGVEIDLSGKIISGQDFSWNMNVSFTKNVSEVVDMAGSGYFSLNGFTSTSSGVAEGQPFAVLRGGVYDRDDNGDYILNEYGFPTAAAEADFIGDPNPDWRGGIGTSITYKNFSLSALLEVSQGNDVWNGTRGVLNYFGVHPDTAVESVASQDLVNAFGDVISAGSTFRGFEHDFGGGPVAVDHEWWLTNGGGFGSVSEIFIEDASWARLRELSLSYSLPKKFISPLGLSDVQFSVTGRNLFLWTDVEGFDPDNNLTGASKGRGLEYFSNPGTKSYIGTVRLSF